MSPDVRVRQPAQRRAEPVGAVFERPVRPQAEPALGEVAARQPAYEQRALAHARLEAEPPVGGVALPVARTRQHRLKLQAEPPLERAPGLQLDEPDLAHVAGRDRRGAETVERLGLALEAHGPAPERPAEIEAAGRARQGQQVNGARGGLEPEPQSRRALERALGAAVERHAARAGPGHAARGEQDVVDPVRDGHAAGQGGIRAGSAKLPALSREPVRFFGYIRAAPAERDRAYGQALLEQAAVGAHGGVGHEAAAHHVAVEAVGDGCEAHAEVVRHDAAHALAAPAGGAPAGVVHGLPKPIAAREAQGAEPPQVAHGGAGLHGEREKARVGRDDKLRLHAAL